MVQVFRAPFKSVISLLFFVAVVLSVLEFDEKKSYDLMVGTCFSLTLPFGKTAFCSAVCGGAKIALIISAY